MPHGNPYDDHKEPSPPPARGPHKPSVEYNLEKEPLRTGERDTTASLAEQFRMAPQDRQRHERPWALLALWLLALLAGIGLVVIVWLLLKSPLSDLESLLE